MSKIQPTLIGRNSWFCNSCLEDPSTSDPIKSSPTPHCTICKKHHPIHRDCNGVNISPPPIDYMALFYLSPKPSDLSGVT